MDNFNETLWHYYAGHGRNDLPWRQPEANGQFDPYKIVVSELMLQQTQVSRVIPKFHEFLMVFPTLQALAEAELSQVITTWSGLGYNRRAKFLWQTAQIVNSELSGRFPETLEAFVKLPGIGKNTAGAVLAYAFNKPALFIETNVRTVYIYHFFNDHAKVSDAMVAEKLAETLDHEQPRQFYWALMDYGTHLKQTLGNLNKVSTTYAKQSKFEGSQRQIRGQVLRLLAQEPMTAQQIATKLPDPQLPAVLAGLTTESLIVFDAGQYRL